MQHQNSTAQTVFLVDDDASIRSALTRALNAEGFQVRTWATAEAFLADYDPNDPGCLLTDVLMPGANGLQLQAELATRGLKLPIVFISASPDVPTSVQAMRLGAVTFMTKPVRLAELTAALQEAMEADREWRARRESHTSIQRRLTALTPREREVFDLVVLGRMNKQIAAKLGMAEKTTKVHRGRVMRKMNVRSVAELVIMATQLRSEIED